MIILRRWLKTAREARLVSQQDNTPFNAENTYDIPFVLKPDSLDVYKNVLKESIKTQDNNLDDVERNKGEDKPENTIESDQLTREKQQIKAMGLIGTKLA